MKSLGKMCDDLQTGDKDKERQNIHLVMKNSRVCDGSSH